MHKKHETNTGREFKDGYIRVTRSKKIFLKPLNSTHCLSHATSNNSRLSPSIGSKPTKFPMSDVHHGRPGSLVWLLQNNSSWPPSFQNLRKRHESIHPEHYTFHQTATKEKKKKKFKLPTWKLNPLTCSSTTEVYSWNHTSSYITGFAANL